MLGIGASSYRRYLANNPETLEMLVHSYSDALVRYAYSYVGDAGAAEGHDASAHGGFVGNGAGGTEDQGVVRHQKLCTEYFRKNIHKKVCDVFRFAHEEKGGLAVLKAEHAARSNERGKGSRFRCLLIDIAVMDNFLFYL